MCTCCQANWRVFKYVLFCYVRVYDRLTMFHHDKVAGEDVYLLPGDLKCIVC
jgi:hypothetical protein